MKSLGRFINKKLLIVLAIVILIIAIGAAVFLYLNSDNSTENQQPEVNDAYATCDNDDFYTMVVADQIFLSDKLDEFQPVAEKIQATEGHESSPNCMYLITMYAIATGDRENAPMYYGQYKDLYNANNGYTGTWKDSNVQQPKDLAATIEFMESDKSINGQITEWSGDESE